MEPAATPPFRGSDAVREGRVTWTALAGPRYQKLGPDTYVPVATVVDARVRIVAGLVRAGAGAIATGWSSVLLHGLDVAPREMPVEVAQPARHLRSDDGTTFHRRRFEPDEVVDLDGLRATTPLRTAYDLATRPGLDDAVVAADALGRRAGFSGADLAALAARRPGDRGVRRVAAVATLMDPRSESPPETRTRLLFVRSELPAPVPQFRVTNVFGWEIGRVDLAWPTYRVAIEYDGRDHARADRRGRDLDRLEDLRREGWVVIVLTSRQLRQRERTIAHVRRALVGRGWTPNAR